MLKRHSFVRLKLFQTIIASRTTLVGLFVQIGT
jgi:hypothetical protein